MEIDSKILNDYICNARDESKGQLKSFEEVWLLADGIMPPFGRFYDLLQSYDDLKETVNQMTQDSKKQWLDQSKNKAINRGIYHGYLKCSDILALKGMSWGEFYNLFSKVYDGSHCFSKLFFEHIEPLKRKIDVYDEMAKIIEEMLGDNDE